MIVISHRVNTIAELKRIPSEFGVEVDLRDYDGQIVVQHDPLKGGENFKEYLRHYHHRFIILNVKCEGIEDEVLHLVADRGIADFFLLDLSFPALFKLIRKGEKRIAVRFSEIEPIEACLALAGLVEWAWIDCFTDFPVMGEYRDQFLSKFRTCLVSPEMQGRPPLTRDRARAVVDLYQAGAVCTKLAKEWTSH